MVSEETDLELRIAFGAGGAAFGYFLAPRLAPSAQLSPLVWALIFGAAGFFGSLV
jgi:hypothetical protein